VALVAGGATATMRILRLGARTVASDAAHTTALVLAMDMLARARVEPPPIGEYTGAAPDGVGVERRVRPIALAGLPGDLPGEALMLLVETAGFVNPRLGLQAIERALAQPGLSDTDRAELTRLRQETGQLYPEAMAAAEPKTISIAADPFVMALTEGDIFTPTRIEKLKLYQGIPLKVTEAGLELRMAEGKRSVLPFVRIFAIAAAAVREIGNAPYLLIDLLTDDPLAERAHHGCLRLNGLQFSAAALLAVNEPPAQAMRSLIRLLARHSGATILPDEAALDGDRFPSYASIEEFELATYGVTSR